MIQERLLALLTDRDYVSGGADVHHFVRDRRRRQDEFAKAISAYDLELGTGFYDERVAFLAGNVNFAVRCDR